MAFCPNCGSEIKAGAAFCGGCGTPVKAQQAQPQAQPAPQVQAQPVAQQAQPYQQSYQQAYQQPNYGAPAGAQTVQADRSLLVYIVLSIVTCGIYSWWFTYKLAQDMNTVCKDGDNTPGLAAYILFSIITCGIYAYWWQYKIGNRQQANAAIYGFVINENGTTILLWDIVGLLLCGLGPFIAMNIIIKNMNKLAAAYNARVMQGQQVF